MHIYEYLVHFMNINKIRDLKSYLTTSKLRITIFVYSIEKSERLLLAKTLESSVGIQNNYTINGFTRIFGRGKIVNWQIFCRSFAL